VHVLDAAEGDLEERFRAVDGELAAYGAGLAERPQLVVLNKIDLLADPPAFQLDDERIAGVVSVSCVTGAGIDELERRLFELCPVKAEEPAEQALPEYLDYRPLPSRGPSFRVLRTDRGYRVVGTPPPPEELEEALRRIGIKRGAEVEVGGEALEWSE
jgi:predicted GTPase